MFRTGKTAVVLWAAALVTTSTFAQEPLRVSSGEVTGICPLTVGGSFEAKTKHLSGGLAVSDSESVKGALTVDLQTLQAGIGLRDQHLKNNYLEVDKGPSSRRRVCRTSGSNRSRERHRSVACSRCTARNVRSRALLRSGRAERVSAGSDVPGEGLGVSDS